MGGRERSLHGTWGHEVYLTVQLFSGGRQVARRRSVAAVVGGVLHLFQESKFCGGGIVTVYTQLLLYAQPALISRKVKAKQSL